MSFYKNYPNRHDHRKPYVDERAIDATCQCHGSCGCRKRKRDYKFKRQGGDNNE